MMKEGMFKLAINEFFHFLTMFFLVVVVVSNGEVLAEVVPELLVVFGVWVISISIYSLFGLFRLYRYFSNINTEGV